MRIYDYVLDREFPEGAPYEAKTATNADGSFTVAMHPMLEASLRKHIDWILKAIPEGIAHLDVPPERYTFACGELFGLACRLVGPGSGMLFDALPDAGKGLPHGEETILLADPCLTMGQGRSIHRLQLRLEPVYEDEAAVMRDAPTPGIMQLMVGTYSVPAGNPEPLLQDAWRSGGEPAGTERHT